MNVQPICPKINPVFFKTYASQGISFGGYYGDIQPIKKMYWLVSGQNEPNYDKWTTDNAWYCGSKRWVCAPPNEVLKRSFADTINSVMTLTNQSRIPDNIQSPNIRGDNWGRHANYIEVNPRLIAKYDKGRVSDGLIQTTKLMTMIPPSSNYAPNCIVLSQLYPSFYGDGTSHDETLYHVDLHRGISKNLTCRGLDYKMGDDEQVRAFNDMAHLMGFKTAFRMPISSGQIRIKGEKFSWDRHEKAYIDACVWAIELGFDGIFFDSAKHIIDMDGYCGIGDVPNKHQMAYILNKIREQTGRCDLSFVGEKCDTRDDYRQMGFTAGSYFESPYDINAVKWNSQILKKSYNYAPGLEVSNDNDCGRQSFEQRLQKLNSCLFGFEKPQDKLPAFMQINDILPINNNINIHQVMMNAVQLGNSDAWTECERHWDSVFRTDQDARDYTQAVYTKFHDAMYQ